MDEQQEQDYLNHLRAQIAQIAAGFSGEEDSRNVGRAFEMYPLILALATADMEATYYVENEKLAKN